MYRKQKPCDCRGAKRKNCQNCKGGGKSEKVLDDSRVVPHNKYLLLKYGTHINVEYVFGQKACKYIFKYILKGLFIKT